MTVSGSYELARESAGSAFQRLGKERLAPTPINFTVFYHYYSGRIPQLKRVVDSIASSESGFTDTICQTIYENCLGDARDRRFARAIESEVRRAVGALSTLVDEAGREADSYGQVLEEFTDQLDGAVGLSSLRDAVDNISARTREMKQQNDRLSQELLDTKQHMDELRGDLETVRKEAMCDGLTELGNRRYFDIELRTAIAEANASGEPLSLVMADVDRFKSLNDTYGHQTGDEVLKLVARIIRDSVKGRDIASRYGGEEFAVILPKTTLKNAIHVADQIRAAIAGKRFVKRSTGETLGSVTVSFGVSTLRAEDRSSDLVARADIALYAAKRNGRNRVEAEIMDEAQAALVVVPKAGAATALQAR